MTLSPQAQTDIKLIDIDLTEVRKALEWNAN